MKNGETTIWRKDGMYLIPTKNVKDLNYVYIDEISNPNEWVQITPTLRFQWGYSGHVLGAVWFLVDI